MKFFKNEFNNQTKMQCVLNALIEQWQYQAADASFASTSDTIDDESANNMVDWLNGHPMACKHLDAYYSSPECPYLDFIKANIGPNEPTMHLISFFTPSTMGGAIKRLMDLAESRFQAAPTFTDGGTDTASFDAVIIDGVQLRVSNGHGADCRQQTYHVLTNDRASWHQVPRRYRPSPIYLTGSHDVSICGQHYRTGSIGFIQFYICGFSLAIIIDGVINDRGA